MFLTIIVALLNKKIMWSGEILTILAKTSVIIWGLTLFLCVLNTMLYFSFGITIHQWVDIIIIIAVVVFLLIHEFTENKNRKVLLRISKEKIPEFLQILSSNLMLSNTEISHEIVPRLSLQNYEDYSVHNKNGNHYIGLIDYSGMQVKPSKLLLEEIDIQAFKQEFWNAYKETVIKTSPYFYLLPILSFIAFVGSMIIFSHYYEFTSLYVNQLLYFTWIPMIMFFFVLNVSTSVNSSKS
jgi:hypothetical protein